MILGDLAQKKIFACFILWWTDDHVAITMYDKLLNLIVFGINICCFITNQGRLRISFNANTIRLHYELNYDLILIEPNKMLFLAVSHIAYPTASDSFSYLLIWNED